MRKIIFTTMIAVLLSSTAIAQQFNVSAELRPRYENKHGFKTLLNTNEDGSNFVSQRTRLNFLFKQDNLKLGIALQNVRVWGDVGTLAANDNAISFHQAWAQYKVSDKLSLKFGRQEIIYDDSRIFGNVGWAQQARSHDAMLAKFNFENNSKLDIGLALNSDTQSNKDLLYSNKAGYKAFQYVWYHTNISKIGVSILALNNGVEYLNTNNEQTVNYYQTFGGRATFKIANIMFDASSYTQTGKLMNNKVAAFYLGGNAKFKASDNYTLGLGFEYLSGKDSNDSGSKIKSFNPVFGTNHKFNGLMDYFYVGNHLNSVGLVDIHATIAYKKDKYSLKLIPHVFSSAADIYNGATKMSRSLGTEVDIVAGYKISKNIQFNAGYSRMFATDSMEVLKGGDSSENNSWAWMMFTFKPSLFTSN